MKILQKALLVALIVSLLPGLTAFAAANRLAPPQDDCDVNPVAAPNSPSSAIPVVDDDCCDTALHSGVGSSAIPVVDDDCCDVLPSFLGNGSSAIPVVDDCCSPVSYPGNSAAAIPVLDGCCLDTSLANVTPHGATMAAFLNVTLDDCATPPPSATCGLTLPTGSVVGSLPNNQQAFWAPGKISPNVIVNAGTYWVTGVGIADNGDKFYQILVACQYLWVPIGSMQPSFQAPWQGQPLPTNVIT